MSETTTEDLKVWIDNMMKSEKITDYKTNITGNSVKGDGYLGEISFVTVKTPKKDYELVIKSAKQSPELRKQTPIKEAYDRETFFYTKMFPILDEFQLSKNVQNPFCSVAKCYSVCEEDGKEAIILQNLKSIGFELHDRLQPMNLDELKMIFSQYARFHALSMALKYKKPAVFNSVTRNITDVFGKFVVQNQFMPVFYKDFENLKKTLYDAQEIEALKKYAGFEKEFEKILINDLPKSDEYSVILHGDCWNNNFMFKYKDNDKSKPVDMCFLDFQLSRVDSPVFDLSYAFYCSASKQVFKKLDSLLQVYHSTLSEFLSELGCDVDEIYPFQQLQKDWSAYGKFGVIMSLLILRICLCESAEAPDFTEAAEGGDIGANFGFAIKNKEAYESRLKNVYLHYANKFL